MMHNYSQAHMTLKSSKDIVIITFQRTGSTALQRHLTSICSKHRDRDELFNPWLNFDNVYQKTNITYEQGLEILYKRLGTIGRNKVIVKIMPNIYLPESDVGTKIIERFKKRNALFIVLTRRDTLKAMISAKIARETGIWNSLSNKPRKSRKFKMTYNEVVTFANNYQRFKLMAKMVEGKNTIHLVYEEFIEQLETPFKRLVKNHKEWISNYEEVKKWHNQLLK